MKAAPFAILFLTFFSLPALAESEPSREEMFTLLCRNGPAKGDDRKLRQEFHRFLKNPKPAADSIEKALAQKSNDVGDSLAMVFLYASTCHLVETYRTELLSKGCRDEKNKALPVKKASELCAPLAKRFAEEQERATRETEEAAPDESGDGSAAPAQ